VYALGAVLYELLTGRPPRHAETLADLTKPAKIRPPEGAPAELSRIVMRCLAAEPEKRPASASELARALAATSPEAKTLPLPDDPSRRATEIKAPQARRPRRTVLLVAAAVGAVVGGVVAAVATSGGSTPPPPAPPARVTPIPHAADTQQQARELAAWLRGHSR
jgi:serine/threonine-protein kinase